MTSLEHGSPVLPEMPRFDDGMVDIQELIRIMAESLVNEIMDAQADDACADGNQRNGYRERMLLTSVGPITLKIPKLRHGAFFPEDLLARYSRTDRAVIAAISEMVTCGVSTRKVEKVAATPGIPSMSASQVSRIRESLDAIVAGLQARDLSDVSYPYIWLDATYIKCRDRGRVSSCALVTAIGAASDGHRRLLGLDAIDTESYGGWLAFFALPARARGRRRRLRDIRCPRGPEARHRGGFSGSRLAALRRASYEERRELRAHAPEEKRGILHPPRRIR